LSKPIIILGAGGHARVLADALRPLEVSGFTDSNPLKIDSRLHNATVLGGDDIALAYAPDDIQLVNGIGSVGIGIGTKGMALDTLRRVGLFNRFRSAGYRFLNVIHPSAIMAPDVALGEGVQIMAGTVLQTGCNIGDNTIVNTRASIDHDCHIGAHVHIAPGAVLSGGVTVGDYVHIGAGATIVQGIHIGANCMIAAGAVVIRDIPAGKTVIGVPAKEVKDE